MKIRLAELEKMLETEKEARNELESMKSNLDNILNTNNNPGTYYPLVTTGSFTFFGKKKVNAFLTFFCS